MLLRTYIIHDLNLLETIFTAWLHKVGDRLIIEQEFKNMVAPRPGKTLLSEFINAIGGPQAYPAISSYLDYLEVETFKRKKDRRNTA